jgi:hypothetical protein
MFGQQQEKVWINSNFAHLPGEPEINIGQDVLEMISTFCGAESSGISLFQRVIPYFSLFSSIYFRVVSGKANLISSARSNDGEQIQSSIRFGELDGPEWKISRDDWDAEYEKFVNAYIASKDDISVEIALAEIDDQSLGAGTSGRFYEYFTGIETPLISIGGSCSWPLGCVQNLDPDEFRYSKHLLSENEHSKPKSLFDYKANQKMCCTHNRWKAANPLFDIGGILWCIFGQSVDLD